MQWVWFEYAGTLIALRDFVKAKQFLQTALTRKYIVTQNTIVLMHLAAIDVFENDMQEAEKQCQIAKDTTPNFDLEKICRRSAQHPTSSFTIPLSMPCK